MPLWRYLSNNYDAVTVRFHGLISRFGSVDCFCSAPTMRFNFLFFILQKRDEKGEGKEIPSFFVLQKPDEKSLENAQNNEIPTISMINSSFKVPDAPGDIRVQPATFNRQFRLQSFRILMWLFRIALRKIALRTWNWHMGSIDRVVIVQNCHHKHLSHLFFHVQPFLHLHIFFCIFEIFFCSKVEYCLIYFSSFIFWNFISLKRRAFVRTKFIFLFWSLLNDRIPFILIGASYTYS